MFFSVLVILEMVILSLRCSGKIQRLRNFDKLALLATVCCYCNRESFHFSLPRIILIYVALSNYNLCFMGAKHPDRETLSA